MKTVLVLASLALATVAAAPAAQAEHACVDALYVCVHWECLDVYPWSRLCGGDVVGFLEAVVDIVLRGVEVCNVLSDGVVCP